MQMKTLKTRESLAAVFRLFIAGNQAGTMLLDALDVAGFGGIHFHFVAVAHEGWNVDDHRRSGPMALRGVPDPRRGHRDS